VILALANPEPEIRPEVARAVRPDCIIATGRSDYPNQVNNVLCFPYIFRGALDCGATRITDEMKQACVTAIAELAEAQPDDAVAAAYAGQALRFGPDYIIPTPFDQRLMAAIAPAVAQAAEASGVAERPIGDPDAYRARLAQLVYHTGLFMRPVFAAAKSRPRKVVYADGEDQRVLRAVQTVVDDGLAIPVLIGRGEQVTRGIEQAGLRLRRDVDYALVEPGGDTTLQAARMVQAGEADALLCGLQGSFDDHLERVRSEIGMAPGCSALAAMNGLVLDKYTLFIADTYVNDNPDAQALSDIAQLAAEQIRHFGIVPKVALVSHSIFGSSKRPSAEKMREARDLLKAGVHDLAVVGEVQGDAALSETIRKFYRPDDDFPNGANLLLMPSLDAANIAFNLLKTTSGKGVTVGPILLGAARPVHILNPIATVRRIINMTALAVADANSGG
jgi:malate dehydrogenase (oxaloacetate-decarboxylating)(NADP+)